MEELRPTKIPTRDYQSFSSTPWPLWDTLYARKSHRKYLPYELDKDLVGELEQVVALACGARGAGKGSLKVVKEPAAVRDVRERAYKGMVGKINVWLIRAPVAAFLVMDVPRSDVKADRPAGLPRTTMAVEDAVLWLTEKGLATCWLGGVNEDKVASGLGLGSGQGVPAIISIGGQVGRPGAATYSAFAERTMSRRRKPVSGFAFDETTGTPYSPGDLAGLSFSAAGDGVRGLLERLIKGEPAGEAARAPLPLAIDACLEAARVAPSGGNAQPWLFVVVRDPGRLERLAGLCGADRSWEAALVALSEVKKFETVLLDKPFWMIDVPIALSHVTLAAVSMGYLPQVYVDGIDEAAACAEVAAGPKVRAVGVVRLS